MRYGYRRMCPSFLLLLAASVAGFRPCSAHAQSAPVAGSPFDQIAWFVGGTWTAEEKVSDGSALLVKLNCRWADTRNAIVFKVSFETGGREMPQYDGMFIWHPAKKKLTLWQVNRKGEVAEGELTINGSEMDQTVRVSHLDGESHFLKAHYRRLNNNAFQFTAFFRLSETAEWKDVLDIVYRRQPPSPPTH